MNCKQCNTPLMTIPYILHHMVNYCRSCHGMWIHKDTLDIIAKTTTENASLLQQLADSIPDIDMNANVQEAQCLVCEKTLDTKQHSTCSSIHIKTCSSHGIWMTKEQLMVLEQFLQSEKGTDQHKLAFFASF